MYTIQFYFLVFLAYSILGWMLEIIDFLVTDHKIVDRGFLIGPYCPIYGVGGVLATLLLQKYSNDLVVLFFLGMIIFSVLEYYTSLILEKIFHARWWDYSNKKLNINGRICLNTMIPFGILGVVVIRFVNPFFFGILSSLNPTAFNIIFYVTATLFLIDLAVSVNILSVVGKENRLALKDNTEELKELVIDKIRNHGWLYNRLIKAFPNLKIIIKKTKEILGTNIQEYNKKQQKIKRKADKKIASIRNKYDKKIDKLISKYNKKLMDASDKK